MTLSDGDGCDAQRKGADARLEDALRRLQRDALTLKHEAALQFSPVEKVRR